MSTRWTLTAVLGSLGLAFLQAQSAPPPVVLPNVLPPDVASEQFSVTPDRQRTYFLNPSGEIWLFDRGRKTSTRIVSGAQWDLTVSPGRNAIAYTKRGDKATEQFVWLSELDAKTGLATGAARRLSASPGDVPSISPDGKLVAFARNLDNGVGQSIVVLPAAGGAERVIVPSVPSSVDHIRWAPDGSAIYYGVNPPVACEPEWSCLPLPNAAKRREASLWRASISGGAASTLLTARLPTPGLSPDGTVIAFGEMGGPRQLGVADRDGKKLGSFSFPAGQTVIGWLEGATLLLRSTGTIRRVRTVALAGPAPTLLLETSDRITDPIWSPDGKTVAIVRCVSSNPCEVRLLNPDGSVRQTLPLTDTNADSAGWSPDGRWISYIGRSPSQRLAALELATGKVAALGLESPFNISWLPDSRGLVVAETKGTDTDRRIAFRQFDVGGGSKPLRDVAIDVWPRVATAIDASTALVSSLNERGFRLVPLTGTGPDRVILKDIEAAPVNPVLSDDRRWLAVRRSSGAADLGAMNVIELCRFDGSQRTTIQLPFPAAPGQLSVAILPGAKELVVVEFIRPDADPGVYLVTAATKAVRKLFAYPAGPRSAWPAIAVAPDGRTLLSTRTEPLPPTVSTIDLSVFRQPGRQ